MKNGGQTTLLDPALNWPPWPVLPRSMGRHRYGGLSL